RRAYYDELYLLTVSQWHLAPLFQSHGASRSRGGSAKLLVAAAHRLAISQYLIGELLWCLALLLCLAELVVGEVTVQLRQRNPYGGIRPLRVGRYAHPVPASLPDHHPAAVLSPPPHPPI